MKKTMVEEAPTKPHPVLISNSVTTLDGRPPEKNRLTAGILALLVGGFGVHKFYLGYNNQGIILL